MIKVYFSRVGNKLNNDDFFKYLNFLPTVLREKILKLKKWEDRQAGLFGKLLLKKGLEDLGKDFDLQNLKYTEYGRPYLEDYVDFNISHTTNFVACAISTEDRIGIDAEEIRPILIEDFKNEFSNEEWELILNSENKYYSFYFYWTAKEAVIKADGRGLNIPLQKLTMKNNRIKLGGIVWFIKSITLFDNYILQLASETEIKKDVELLEVSF